MRIDPNYFRPTEAEALLGDPRRAKEKLSWEPEISARDLCREMVASDRIAAIRSARDRVSHGPKAPEEAAAGSVQQPLIASAD